MVYTVTKEGLKGGTAIRFPENIDTHLTTITFSARGTRGGKSRGSVTLYAPAGIAVSDGANYSELELGIFGAEGALASAESLASGSATTEQISKLAKSIGASSNDSTISNLIALEAAGRFGIGGSVSERARDLGMYAKGKAINSNTVLNYSGTNLRDFSFAFNLYPHNERESGLIKTIEKWFRVLMHPEREVNGVLLGYPDLFKINFRHNGKTNTHLPHIKECFLTSLNVVHNPNGNAYHKDGAALETQLNLTFKETHQNSRADIVEFN